MYIQTLELNMIKGFRNTHEITLSKGINILLGPNNSGKSTIINSINALQIPDQGNRDPFNGILPSLNRPIGVIKIKFGNIESYVRLVNDLVKKGRVNSDGYVKRLNEYLKDSIVIKTDTNGTHQTLYSRHKPADTVPNTSDRLYPFAKFHNSEPQNIIYPFLSKRKISNLIFTVDENNIRRITGNFDVLIPKIDSIFQPHHQKHRVYMDICEKILGFHVTTDYQGSNKKAGLYINRDQMIPITAMGEGVMHLLALIVDLCIAEDKIFLIEEPESDLHPKALKALLSLIEEKSTNNQFIISTHSNIVAKYLGASSDTKIFRVSMSLEEGTKIPISKIEEVPNNPIARQEVLEELGYEFYDNDLWKAWMFLEESSAESIIRDFLIPNYVPELTNKLRTFSTNGVDQVKTKLEDFHKLFVYLHLTPIYKNKVWIVVDGGQHEAEILNHLKEHYRTKHNWEVENFLQFSKHSFEEYYPIRFNDKVNAILSEGDRKQKIVLKAELLTQVVEWIEADKKNAIAEFNESAKEIIDILKGIAVKLNN